MDTGYEPSRVHRLVRHTLESIDRLDAIGSSDPVATDALRTVRLARANLEDHWMPALRDIERSAPMVRWRRSRLGTLGLRPLAARGESLPDHLRPGGLAAATIPTKRREELLGQLDWLERRALSGHIGPGAPTTPVLAELAADLATWVRRDDRFAAELVALSTSNMIVGRLLSEARFPPSFASRVVMQMAVPHGPETGVDHDRYAMSLSIALDSLVDDAHACLDLLLDERTTFALASWEDLDPAMLGRFVTSGLLGAVQNDPSRLADGYQVLQFLTAATNQPLDGGVSAGMAIGVSSSLHPYLATLAPAIRGEGDDPVVVRRVTPEVELGTYDQLVELFGALVRVPPAQGHIGRALEVFATEVFETIGGEAPHRVEVGYVVNVADLIGDARQNEQCELMLVAAADEARNHQLGNILGSASNVLMLAGGSGATARAAVSLALETVTAWGAPATPRQIPGAEPALNPYDVITVAAITTVATDRRARRSAGLDSVSPTQWGDVARLLDGINRAVDPHDRTDRVQRLDDWVDSEVPALSAYLYELRKTPGLHALREGDEERCPDE